MSKVSNITPQLRAVTAPTELRALTGWLMWRYEEIEGNPKPQKIPYYADGVRRHGQQGSQADRAKLTSFAAATAAAAKRGMDGVGLALLPDWGITALDFDKCVGPDGSLPSEVTDIVSFTYAEYSPSGEGVRAFVRGNLGNHKDIARADRYGFETFNTNGFVTFTGNVLPEVSMLGYEDTIAEATDAVRSLCDTRFGTSGPKPASDPSDPFAGFQPRIGLSVSDMTELLRALDPDMPREDWIRVGMALHHECEGDDTGFELWDEWSADGVKYPSSEYLRTQWQSFERPQGNHRPVTMATVLRMAKEAGAILPRPIQAATAEELKAVAAEHQVEALARATSFTTPEGFTGKYPIVTAGDLSRRKPTGWLIKGVLPRAEMIVLFGASGSGKTFAVIDMAAAVARGINWRGRRTTKARVLIIAAEGGGGVGKRIDAYSHYHNINLDDVEIGVMTAAPNFLQKPDISEVVAAVTAAGGFDLIIVDTFAQVTPGANENAGEDMGLAISHVRALAEVTGATVLLVHHAGKDASKGARGWSGIRAAADAEIEIIRHEVGPREIRISKMKDGEDSLFWGFKLEQVVVGMDDDGDEITSCVVVETDPPAPANDDQGTNGRVKRVGKDAQHVLDMIELSIDPSVQFMGLSDFVRLCADGMPEPEEGKRDTRMQRVRRALDGLKKGPEAAIVIENGKVIFCK